jgi:hypothetical protein
MSSNFTSREERRRKEELDQARKVRAPTRPSRAAARPRATGRRALSPARPTALE